jgi:hypothetical protein
VTLIFYEGSRFTQMGYLAVEKMLGDTADIRYRARAPPGAKRWQIRRIGRVSESAATSMKISPMPVFPSIYFMPAAAAAIEPRGHHQRRHEGNDGKMLATAASLNI